MTYEEAILIIENETPHCGEKLTFSEEEICEAASIAKEAIEKQIPKKPEFKARFHICPVCKAPTVLDFCSRCGQALDWEGN